MPKTSIRACANILAILHAVIFFFFAFMHVHILSVLSAYFGHVLHAQEYMLSQKCATGAAIVNTFH